MAETQAHAKVNLLLSVRPGAAPDGYHAVETVLCALELCDEVAVEPSEASGIALLCDPDPLDGRPAEGNLAYRAAAAACAAFGVEPSLRIRIAKRIPLQAGLGGGSSDAGAVLRCLAALWGVDPRDPRLERAAASLGADVPFFLDERPGHYAGRGDVLVERLSPLRLPVALVKPPVGVSTAEAYRALDRLAPAELDARPCSTPCARGTRGPSPSAAATTWSPPPAPSRPPSTGCSRSSRGRRGWRAGRCCAAAVRASRRSRRMPAPPRGSPDGPAPPDGGRAPRPRSPRFVKTPLRACIGRRFC